MILLTNTNESLELVTSLAGSVDYTASWADITSTSFAPAAGQGNIATAATTTIVAAPAASTQRQVKLITLRNRDISQTVYLQKNVGGVLVRMTPDVVLVAGEVLQYLDGQGFSVLDPFARPKQASSATLVNPPTANNQWPTTDADVEQILSRLLAEMQLTNLLLQTAFSINLDIDTLRGDTLRVQ